MAPVPSSREPLHGDVEHYARVIWFQSRNPSTILEADVFYGSERRYQAIDVSRPVWDFAPRVVELSRGTPRDGPDDRQVEMVLNATEAL
jgi:hypothetical protein